MPTIHVSPGSASELQEIADRMGKSRKVIVVTGAGISTNCGIPDFRSENGLYSLIQAQFDAALQNPPWAETDNFDIDDRPKKKRRVTDRWYYEIVPRTNPALNKGDDQLPGKQRRGSQASQSASLSTTGSNTPGATHSLESSPLSSPRSLTPQPPSEYLAMEGSSPKPQPEAGSSPGPSEQLEDIALAASVSPSLRSESSTSSTTCTSDNALSKSKLDHQPNSQSCASSSRSTRDDSASATKSDDEPASTLSSQPSSRQSLPNLKGRDLFDSMIWSDPFTTSIFYMFVSSLRQKIQDDVQSTTATHKFIRTLRDGGRLVRNYTQNIDSLEEREGLSTDLTRGPGNRARFHSKTQREPRPSEIDLESPHNGGVEVVLLHGSLVSLRCGICTKLSSWDHAERQSSTFAGSAPDCPACSDYNAKRTGRGRRGLAVGRLRPDIVLYGEEHPNANLVAPLITHDLALGPDFLLIMGTSLKVHGLKVMVKEFAKAVHGKGGKVVFVNRTKPPESTWGEFIDYWVEWDCDEWVLDLKLRRGDIWLPQGRVEESKSRPEYSSDVKAETKKVRRPQALRDDKMNGVYQTFKILDSLGQLQDSSGKKSTRPLHFDKAGRVFVAPVAKSASARKVPQRVPAKASSSKAGNTKRRKSYPGALREDKHNAAFLVTKIWNQLRELAPGLDPTPPESGRIALSELSANFVMPSFNRSFLPNSNYYPNLAGLGPLKQINLITHPPSGATVPIHTPKTVLKPVIGRKPVTHGYSTRASRTASTETTIIVDTPASLSRWPSTEETIVVATPPPQEPTPPTSDPMTPSTQRIKRIGSIGAILSSPEDSDRSSLEVYYDAVE